MAAGVTMRLWEMSDVVDVLEAWEASAMERDYEELAIDKRGDDYVLIRVDGNGIRTEFILSEPNVVFLGRLASTVCTSHCSQQSSRGRFSGSRGTGKGYAAKFRPP